MLIVKDTLKVAQVIKRNAALQTVPPRDFDLGQLPGLASVVIRLLLLYSIASNTARLKSRSRQYEAGDNDILPDRSNGRGRFI